ncbi:MAG: tetratricopeptide repeat domain protein, partial [Verrucomicrobiales bacterium]|nr:tetratricopeptide repeat domain protein [Verrucomicrobiales bacterium]
RYNPKPDGAKMEAELRGATEFDKRNDYSVALMYLGRSQEAVTLLEGLEKEKPGQYTIAANLGTAYELSGNNAQALHWISEGIRRDATSHEGTEWLHVKILEAKIAQEKDADYFKKHSVLNLSPETIEKQSDMKIGDQSVTLLQLRDALFFQLKERLQFVKQPDPAVASLFFDFAAVAAATNTLESATILLEMALKFGYPPDRVQPLLEVYKQRISAREAKEEAVETEARAAVKANWLKAAILCIPIVVIVVILYRQVRRKFSTAA